MIDLSGSLFSNERFVTNRLVRRLRLQVTKTFALGAVVERRVAAGWIVIDEGILQFARLRVIFFVRVARVAKLADVDHEQARLEFVFSPP